MCVVIALALTAAAFFLGKRLSAQDLLEQLRVLSAERDVQKAFNEQHAQEQASLKEQHTRELDSLKEQHARELASLKEQHARQQELPLRKRW